MAEKVITIADSITVGELAEKLNLPVTNLIGELFKNGIVSTILKRLRLLLKNSVFWMSLWKRKTRQI